MSSQSLPTKPSVTSSMHIASVAAFTNVNLSRGSHIRISLMIIHHSCKQLKVMCYYSSSPPSGESRQEKRREESTAITDDQIQLNPTPLTSTQLLSVSPQSSASHSLCLKLLRGRFNTFASWSHLASAFFSSLSRCSFEHSRTPEGGYDLDDSLSFNESTSSNFYGSL